MGKAYAKTGKIGDTTVAKYNSAKPRQPGILIVADNTYVNEHFVEEVHDNWHAMEGYRRGYMGSQTDLGKTNWQDGGDPNIFANLQTFQAHWQASGIGGATNPVPDDVQDGRSLNGQVETWMKFSDDPKS